jgi:hypothetical protein
MAIFKDIYSNRLMTCNLQAKNKDGQIVRINYKVDLVTALNNVPSSPDYDESIPMHSGTKFRVTYRTPEQYENIAYFIFGVQVESFLKVLDDPDSEFYQKSA